MKNEKIRVPKLRFKEFSGKWKEKKLGDIGKVSMCKRIMKEQTTIDEKIPFYKIGTFGKEADAFISEELYRSYKSKYSFPKKGDILISASGTIGRTVVYNGEDAYFQDSNIVWIDNKEEMTKNSFLIFCYENIKWNTENTTIARLYNDNLRNIQLNIPAIQEQEKIASFLSSIDKKIEQLSKKDELLESYKKGVMQKIFAQEIRFKKENGSDYPDWEKTILDSVCKIKKGTQLNKDTLTLEGIYPALNGGINPSGFTTVWNTEKNTITISEGGNSCGFVNFIKEKFWSGGHNYSLQELNIKLISNHFLYQYLKFNELAIMNLRVGSGLPNIQKSAISNFKILLPDIKEQTKIANFLSSIDTKISQNKKALEVTKKFKKALLQQMFA